jgi:hypothetical protein
MLPSTTRRMWWLRQFWGFEGPIFEDAPRSRVCACVHRDECLWCTVIQKIVVLEVPKVRFFKIALRDFFTNRPLWKLILKMDAKLDVRGMSTEVCGSTLRALAPWLSHVSAKLAPPTLRGRMLGAPPFCFEPSYLGGGACDAPGFHPRH